MDDAYLVNLDNPLNSLEAVKIAGDLWKTLMGTAIFKFLKLNETFSTNVDI